jgi:hypothetical protein
MLKTHFKLCRYSPSLQEQLGMDDLGMWGSAGHVVGPRTPIYYFQPHPLHFVSQQHLISQDFPTSTCSQILLTNLCGLEHVSVSASLFAVGQEINFAICHCTDCRSHCGAIYTANAWFHDTVRKHIFSALHATKDAFTSR